MQLSSYQERIIDWVKNGEGHGCCNAVAGSGKSTTLRLAAKALEESGVSPYEIKICVFGKANAQDLIAKFGKAWESSISTLHSAGWSLLKRYLQIKNPQGLVSSSKYKAIAQNAGLLKSRRQEGGLKRDRLIEQESDFTTLIDLVRLTNQPALPEIIRDICDHFEIAGIREYSLIASAIDYVLQEGEAEARKVKRFDFTDQIWLPVRWGLKPLQPYNFVLVDECQDLNAAQLELVLSFAGQDGRVLAVGDPRQAIMGFAGADNRSYQKIVTRLQAEELPLSICYRCPSSAIKLVKKNFPEIPIEASPTAPEGKIESILERDLWDVDKSSHLVEGDMVISRKTAPLVSLCIKLIARGIAATVKGKAIGEQIKGDLEEIAKMPGFSYEKFNETVDAYRLAKRQRYEGLDNEEQLIEALNDKLEALTTIYKSQPQATCIQHLSDYIDGLFSDEHSPITLSTCHRAKGLEGDRIFIIKPEDMPMTWRNQQPWQLEQENNLLYVALTRTKSELYIVGDPNWLELKKEETTVNPTVNSDSDELNRDDSTTVNTTVNVSSDISYIYAPVEVALIENPHRSDRFIAELCGVSAPTVAKYRNRLLERGLIDSNGKRLGKHGKILKTDNIGTKPEPTILKILKLAETLSKEEVEQLISALKNQA